MNDIALSRTRTASLGGFDASHPLIGPVPTRRRGASTARA